MNNNRTQIVKHLLVLGAFLQREATRITSEFGLTQQQFVVLKTVEEMGPLCQKNICCSLLFEKSNVSKIIKKLETDKLIVIDHDTHDNRVSSPKVTVKGRKILKKGMERFNEWNSAWLEVLSEGEISSSLDVLERLTNIAR
jgi:DNA-binding MarR family transcriptional regulator